MTNQRNLYPLLYLDSFDKSTKFKCHNFSILPLSGFKTFLQWVYARCMLRCESLFKKVIVGIFFLACLQREVQCRRYGTPRNNKDARKRHFLLINIIIQVISFHILNYKMLLTKFKNCLIFSSQVKHVYYTSATFSGAR